MSVIINNFEIINNGTQLSIYVETEVGSNIISILLWDINTFKDPTLAANLNYKLEQITNKEIIIVDAEELGISSFRDLYFIEVESNYVGETGCVDCQLPALGITYNLQEYYKCMLNYLLEVEKTSLPNEIDVVKSNKTITVNLIIDSIEKALEIGYYIQAIELIKKLKSLCGITKCKNCQTITCNSCSKFKQH